MINRPPIFKLVFVFIIINDLYADINTIDSLIYWGIEQSINQNYANAESTFKQIIKLDKNHPSGYFFLAATLQSKMMDYETDNWEAAFLFFLNKTEKYARELIVRDGKDIWAHFYLGSAHSYKAFYDGKKKNYVSAIKYGLSGISSLKKVIEIDSTFYDAYFGIGSFKYWRSKSTRFINWLPLIADERESGIEMIKLAALRGKYTNYAAINELVWILIDAGRVSEALNWAKLGIQKYPNSRFFLWGIARSYFNLNQFENALAYYQKILSSIQQESFNNHYNQIICYYKMARCYFHLGQYNQASRLCDRIFSLELTPDVKKRLSDIFKQVNHLQDKIKKKENHE